MLFREKDTFCRSTSFLLYNSLASQDIYLLIFPNASDYFLSLFVLYRLELTVFCVWCVTNFTLIFLKRVRFLPWGMCYYWVYTLVTVSYEVCSCDFWWNFSCNLSFLWGWVEFCRVSRATICHYPASATLYQRTVRLTVSLALGLGLFLLLSILFAHHTIQLLSQSFMRYLYRNLWLDWRSRLRCSSCRTN